MQYYQLTGSGFLQISEKKMENGGKDGCGNYALATVDNGVVSITPTCDTPPEIEAMEGWDNANWDDDRLNEDAELAEYLDGELREGDNNGWEEIAEYLLSKINRKHKTKA